MFRGQGEKLAIRGKKYFYFEILYYLIPEVGGEDSLEEILHQLVLGIGSINHKKEAVKPLKSKYVNRTLKKTSHSN